MKSIAIIIPYFGKWPSWFDLFLESCKWNSSIKWIFYSDCDEIQESHENIVFNHIKFDEYCAKVSQILKINFNPKKAYKLCDIKPSYGLIHEKDLSGFDYFGFGDIDVIYGNLRKFLTDDILQYKLISTHENKISGHFCLLKNTDDMRNAFRRIKNWKGLFEDPEHHGLDESKFTKVFIRHRKHPMILRKIWGLFDKFQRNNFWKEQYSTILAPSPWHDGSSTHPEEWYWKNGRLTNNRDGDREFMYLHFMNWKSSTWLPKELRLQNVKAAWEEVDNIIHIKREDIPKGFKVNRTGFHPL